MRKALLVGGLLGLPVMIGASHEIPRITMDHDPRLQRLQEFFAQRDCPLADSAADFLLAALRIDELLFRRIEVRGCLRIAFAVIRS